MLFRAQEASPRVAVEWYLSSANERYEILQAVLAQFSAIVFCHDKSYVTFRENGRYLHDERLRYFGRLKVVSFGP